MGLGDEILAAGQARRIHERTGKKVTIGTGAKVIWNPLYDYIPYLTKSGGEWLIDCPGQRGYISGQTRDQKGNKVILFNWDYELIPPIIELDAIETDYVIVEPKIKPSAPPGKLWKRYQEVVDAFPNERFLEFNGPTLERVDSIKTDIVTAARYIKGCKAYVGAEGFLHHLCGAFGTPAVVLFGAHSFPKLEYENQTAIKVDEPSELGNRGKQGAMDKIPAERVIEALRHYLG
jgi:hypothetical protein